MVVDERSRHELLRRLDEVLGTEAATTLIEHLPPAGWSDVATKRDLDRLSEQVDHRFADFEHRMDARFADFEHRMDARFAEVDKRFEVLEVRLESVRHELTATIEAGLRTQSMQVILGMNGVVFSMAALAFSLVRFT